MHVGLQGRVCDHLHSNICFRRKGERRGHVDVGREELYCCRDISLEEYSWTSEAAWVDAILLEEAREALGGLADGEPHAIYARDAERADGVHASDRSRRKIDSRAAPLCR